MSEETSVHNFDQSQYQAQTSQSDRQISFSLNVAQDIGVYEAIVLPIIAQGIMYAGPDNPAIFRYILSRWWFLATFEFLEQELPCFSRPTLTKTIRSLEKQTLILSHNSLPGRDYTRRWYALHPRVEQDIRKLGDRLPPPPPRSNLGYVYLLEGDGGYKIGKTKSLKRRSRQIGSQLPFPILLADWILCEDMDATEVYWHNFFAAKRLNGEWFDLDKEDVQIFMTAAKAERNKQI